MSLTPAQQTVVKQECDTLIHTLIEHHFAAYNLDDMLKPDTLKKMRWLKTVLENEVTAGINHSISVNYNLPSTIYHCKQEIRYCFTQMLVHPTFLL